MQLRGMHGGQGMWVIMSDSMLSIVRKHPSDRLLTVRARAKGDIERIFPDAKVQVGGGTDYMYRAKIQAKKVADALSGLFKNDRKHYEDCWNAYEVVVKLGMLEDEKFLSKVKDILIWKTATSNWKTTEELIRESEGTKNIVYCEPEQEKSPLVAAYTARGIDVAVRTSVLDHPLMSQLEQNLHVVFRRLDQRGKACMSKRIAHP